MVLKSKITIFGKNNFIFPALVYGWFYEIKILQGMIILKFYAALQKHHQFTDYQIKVVHYAIITLVSELSKFLMLGIFFFALGKEREYLWTILNFSFLRRYSGGFHCKTYIGCISMSFLYSLLCIAVLPNIVISAAVQRVFLCVSMAVLAVIAPVPSVYHAELDKTERVKCRTIVLAIVIVYFILVSGLSQNSFFKIGFWVIMIHTIQLMITYYTRRMEN